MTFPVLGIPGPNDVPSNSQGQIQTNFNSIIGWGAVDHIGYGATNSGTHNQISYVGLTSPVPGVMNGAQSVEYSKAGTQDSTKAQLYFKNSLGDYPISLIKAFAIFDNMGAVVAGFGFSNATFSGGAYTVNLNPVLPTAIYGVIAFPLQGATGSFLSYVVNDNTKFTINQSNTSTPVGFTVVVLQF